MWRRIIWQTNISVEYFTALFLLEIGGNKILQNDGNHLPNYTESDARRPSLNIPFVRILNLMLLLLVHLVEYRARCCIVMAGREEVRGQSWRVTYVRFKYTQKRTVGWRNNPFPLSVPSPNISRNHTTDYIQSHQFTRLFLAGVSRVTYYQCYFSVITVACIQPAPADCELQWWQLRDENVTLWNKLEE